MTDSLFVRVKPLNVKKTHGATSHKTVIRTAARHLLRELQAEIGADVDGPIDAARIHMNYVLRGPTTSAGVADLARALLANAKVEHKRADAIQALEVVFSLPPGSAIDHREYFGAAVAWADEYFNVPIISAVVHLDEDQVHAHLLLLPLLDGRLQGGALIGGPTKIKAMMSDFHKQVGQRFGLVHQPRAKRLSKANRDTGGRMVLDEIKSRPERLNDPAVRDALVAALGQHAESLLALLGLTMPAPAKAKTRSFVEIMCSPVTTERKPRKTTSIHVGDKGGDDMGQADLRKPAQDPSNMFVTVHVAPADPASTSRAQPFQQATDGAVNPAASQRQQFATEIKVRAERKCGEMLRTSAERGERATPAKGAMIRDEITLSNDTTRSLPSLADIGITRDQSSRYQQLAAMPDEHFETAVATVGHCQPAGALLRFQAPAPSTADHAAPTSAGTALEARQVELVTAPSNANRPASHGRPAWPPGSQGARASPTALTLTHQLLALASITDQG